MERKEYDCTVGTKKQNQAGWAQASCREKLKKKSRDQFATELTFILSPYVIPLMGTSLLLIKHNLG